MSKIENGGAADLTYGYIPPDGKNHMHTWTLVGPKGGVHIWALPNSDEWFEKFGERFVGGVECHWPATTTEQHHSECWLLKGPCRHDGTSLYFSERIAPKLSPENINGPNIAGYMERELRDWYRVKIEGCWE